MVCCFFWWSMGQVDRSSYFLRRLSKKKVVDKPSNDIGQNVNMVNEKEALLEILKSAAKNNSMCIVGVFKGNSLIWKSGQKRLSNRSFSIFHLFVSLFIKSSSCHHAFSVATAFIRKSIRI